MEVCIRYGGQLHCFFIPIIEWPIRRHIPGPGPVNYPAFLHDLVAVASLQAAAAAISDEKVRQAVVRGCAEGVKAIQAHAGADVTIKAISGE